VQDDIVPKPFQIPELMQKTDQLMARQRSNFDGVEGEDDYF